MIPFDPGDVWSWTNDPEAESPSTVRPRVARRWAALRFSVALLLFAGGVMSHA